MADPFCALCVHGTEGLEPDEEDGKTILICRRCREEHPNEDGYSFSSGRIRGKPSKGKGKSVGGRRR